MNIVETHLFKEPLGGYAFPNTPDMIIIHCSATRPLERLGARDVDAWHRSKGWLGIGYHYVIRVDGTIERGRPEEMRGAHAVEVNDHSIGICLIGGVNAEGKPEANFTANQLQKLNDLLLDVAARHSIDTSRIIGHRDIPGVNKACPSFNVQHWLTSGDIIA